MANTTESGSSAKRVSCPPEENSCPRLFKGIRYLVVTYVLYFEVQIYIYTSLPVRLLESRLEGDPRFMNHDIPLTCDSCVRELKSHRYMDKRGRALAVTATLHRNMNHITGQTKSASERSNCTCLPQYRDICCMLRFLHEYQICGIHANKICRWGELLLHTSLLQNI